ncbi:MAG: hypothetical protein ACXWAC_13405 [Usitatibacter sp.]
MKRRSSLRLFWALAAVLSLAFSQVALAAFACPMSSAQMASAMADGQGCPGSDPGASQLCVKSCQGEPQKHDVASLAALPPSFDAGLRVEPIQPPALASGVDRDVLLARATSPPPNILFVRFLK